ncbi:MAG: recombinase family protein [Fimbriimonas sp.]
MGRARRQSTTTTARPTERPRCVIYTRVSSKDQAQAGYSLDAQLRILQEYARRNDFEVVDTIVEDETAKKAGRKKFSEMLKLIRREGVSELVGEKTDRVYRNFRDQVDVGDLIEEHGLKLHLVIENEVLHKDSPSHQILIHDIKLAMAKNYIKNLREEIRKGMLEKAQQGVWPSTAPLGYRNVIAGAKRVIEPDPKEGPLVRELFAMYATGAYSIKSAAKVAASLGLRSKKGNRVGTSSLYEVLTNPIYHGVIQWKGQVYPGVHEPLIDLRTFERVQAVLIGKVNNEGGGNGSSEYAYRGLIHCARCGRVCSPSTVKGRYVYYACSGQAQGCPRTGIREEEVTRQIAEALEALAIQPRVLDTLRRQLSESFDDQRREHEARQELLATEHKRLSAALERLYKDKVAGEVPASTYQKLRDEWEAQLADVETAQAAEQRANRATWEDAAQMIDLASNSALRFKEGDSEDRRELLQSMASNTQLIDGKIVLELRPWFKSLMKANLQEVRGEVPESDFENWRCRPDSNR